MNKKTTIAGDITLSLINKIKNYKKSKPNVKKIINIMQKDDKLIIKGSFHPQIHVTELWLVLRNTNIKIKITSQKPNNNFNFDIPLRDLMNVIDPKNEERIYDWYFKVIDFTEEIDTNLQKSSDTDTVKVDGRIYSEVFVRCGRFMDTSVSNLNIFYFQNDYLLNYITVKGGLSLSLNQKPNSKIKKQIDKVKIYNEKMVVEGKLFTRNALIENIKILARSRDFGDELYSEEVYIKRLTDEIRRKYGLNRYYYKVEIDLLKMNDYSDLEEDVYDVFFFIKTHNSEEKQLVRVGNPTVRAKMSLKDMYKEMKHAAVIINPYYTFKLKNLSFEIYKYPIESFRYLRKRLKYSSLIRLLNFKKDVWLVGERTYKAQDTGYSFFKFMRENYPDKEVYYVIEGDSPEKKNVEKYGNVLEYKSIEHIKKSIIAKKVISSHHPDYLYPLRTETFKKKIKAVKIFLQHGVMGTKNMVSNYGKKAHGFDTDVFLVSSDFERRMIIKDFGYSPTDVYVTGLSRFDSLFANDIEVKNQILIIPTWRDWLVSDQEFLESEYYERYKSLINNAQLHELAKQYGFEIVFCLHPNMQKYSEYFEGENVTIIYQGEVDVQFLIKSSKLMITDFSSVGFDFSFLHKPIIYYQFDRDRFIGERPSHLDLDNDLPGDIVFEEQDIIDLLKEYCKLDFKVKVEHVNRSNKFIKYRDRNNSQRIFEVINNHKVKRKLMDNPKINILIEALYSKFRKSKRYFPTMKILYHIGKWIVPIDERLILFESGIGKQYSDSPRMIYEKILEEELDYKKVWVYNGPIRFIDEKTKVIKRLSPQYYYYLLRAKYWVNNQNFPTYITKRRGTIYLQTWHGTPLKKMLFDLDKVYGRKDDYIERVGKSIKNWDYLISPSKYASNAFRSAFRFSGEMLEVGYPRNDIFYSDQRSKFVNETLNRLHLPKDKKVILYAPTFRDHESIGSNHFVFQLKLDLEKMKEKLGDEYVLLLRMHVVIKNSMSIDEELSDFVFDVSNYSDIQELLLITDVLITDYSSIMFDFANTKRPMLFYTYDLEQYRDDIRGFYMNFEKEAPGPLLFNTDEVIDKLIKLDEVKASYKEKYATFYQKYCSLEDGKASERVVNEIFKK